MRACGALSLCSRLSRRPSARSSLSRRRRRGRRRRGAMPAPRSLAADARDVCQGVERSSVGYKMLRQMGWSEGDGLVRPPARARSRRVLRSRLVHALCTTCAQPSRGSIPPR